MRGDGAVRATAALAVVATLAAGTVACSSPEVVGPDPSGPDTPVASAPATATATPTAGDTVEPAPMPRLTAEPTPTPSPSPPPRLDAFDVDRAMTVVAGLADTIGPRPAGSPGDAEARRFVATAFRDAGWVVSEEPVPLPQGGSTANVVARPPGTSLGRPHVVVGAHLDTVADTPGANDNATGIGVLVSLATELADEHGEHRDPVVLVAFGAEEYQPSEPREHHLGSQAYVDRRGGQVVEMLNVDMVGNGSPTCICWLRGSDDGLARRVADVAAREELAVRVEARGDISDHGPFALAGIPAAFLWTYDDGVLHTPADTVDRIRPEDVDRAGRLVLAWLRSR